ncbi:G2/mitotic-specific cyclin-B3-like [Anneissia japonica]|uniref:G2/mitotic-specific cyclin-B3-like n=1 Tax=Anneissia japonica TaxID=1529436 RepID=UPI0014255295|nr:G2/mitotic-specific cyclin-B3-like [Anneissia japonica]
MPQPALRKKRTAVLTSIHQDGVGNTKPFTRAKRRSEGSPPNQNASKRAFMDITNAFGNKKCVGTKKGVGMKVSLKKPTATKKVMARAKTSKEDLTVHNEDSVQLLPEISSQGSNKSTSSQESVSSQESNSSDVELIMNEKNTENNKALELKDAVASISLNDSKDDITDFRDLDAENADNIYEAPDYAADIFKYQKERELKFKITPYFEHQVEITTQMRAVLVDWLVEIQESFELNHETLYLAVKLVDHYLMHKKNVGRDILQLVGATALFISCKFDERSPPLLDDFKYICDDAYKRKDFIMMEMSILKTIGFDLGIPISYRFLRRYAKCARSSMETLTLARFILETSLHDSAFIEKRDSQVAAGALLLAFRMKKSGEWDNTLQYYSGYTEKDLESTVRQLNSLISASPDEQLMTVRNKYSHPVFNEVAKIPPLDILYDL